MRSTRASRASNVLHHNPDTTLTMVDDYHPPQSKPPTPPEPMTFWNCSECEVGYHNHDALAVHITQTHSNQNMVVLPQLFPPSSSSQQSSSMGSAAPTPTPTISTRGSKSTRGGGNHHTVGSQPTRGGICHGVSKCWRCSNFVLLDEIDSHVAAHEDYWQNRWELQFSSPTGVKTFGGVEESYNNGLEPVVITTSFRLVDDGNNNTNKPCPQCDKCQLLFFTMVGYEEHMKWNHDRILHDPDYSLYLQQPQQPSSSSSSTSTTTTSTNPSHNTHPTTTHPSHPNPPSSSNSTNVLPIVGDNNTLKNFRNRPGYKSLGNFDYRGGGGGGGGSGTGGGRGGSSSSSQSAFPPAMIAEIIGDVEFDGNGSNNNNNGGGSNNGANGAVGNDATSTTTTTTTTTTTLLQFINNRGDQFYNESNRNNRYRNLLTTRPGQFTVSTTATNLALAIRNNMPNAGKRQPLSSSSSSHGMTMFPSSTTTTTTTTNINQQQTAFDINKGRPGPPATLIRDPDFPSRILCIPCNRYLAQNRVKHNALHQAYEDGDMSLSRCDVCRIAFDSLAAYTRHCQYHADGPCNEQGAGRSTDPRWPNHDIVIRPTGVRKGGEIVEIDENDDGNNAIATTTTTTKINTNTNINNTAMVDGPSPNVSGHNHHDHANCSGEGSSDGTTSTTTMNDDGNDNNDDGNTTATLMIDGILHTFCERCLRYVRRMDIHNTQHHNYDYQTETMYCCFDCQLGYVSKRGYDLHMAEHPKLTQPPFTPVELVGLRFEAIKERARNIARRGGAMSSVLGSIDIDQLNNDDLNAAAANLSKISAKDIVFDEDKFQPHTCERCSLIVPNVTRQKVHLLLHARYDQGDSQWRCDLCAVAWDSEGKWKNHMESVAHLEHKQKLAQQANPIAMFKCNRCNRDWPVSSQRTHDKLHQFYDSTFGPRGNKSIKTCIICELGWEDQLGLDAHNEEVHGVGAGGRSSRRGR